MVVPLGLAHVPHPFSFMWRGSKELVPPALSRLNIVFFSRLLLTSTLLHNHEHISARVIVYGREWPRSFLDQKVVCIFLGFIGPCAMETEHISSPEVIKELQGGLKALSGKTVIVLVSLGLSYITV